MKRRLDLALALVHEPRILFLDEPTTGLDPQSRAALWEEVARLAHDEGMTVFLTTQYLEEADALADRIGIIDRGKIVAEGTPDAAEGRDRQPERRGRARATRTHGDMLAELLSRFGAPQTRRRAAASPCSCPAARRELAEIVRLLDSNDAAGRVAAAAPAVARRRVPGQDRTQARGSRRASERGEPSLLEQVAARRPALGDGHLRQRALLIFPMLFPLILFAINGSALSRATEIPGLPHPQLPRVPARDARSSRARCSCRSRPARASRATSRPAS